MLMLSLLFLVVVVVNICFSFDRHVVLVTCNSKDHGFLYRMQNTYTLNCMSRYYVEVRTIQHSFRASTVRSRRNTNLCEGARSCLSNIKHDSKKRGENHNSRNNHKNDNIRRTRIIEKKNDTMGGCIKIRKEIRSLCCAAFIFLTALGFGISYAVFARIRRSECHAPCVPGSEDIMSPKAHGTSNTPVQDNLRWGVDGDLADRICVSRIFF